MEFEEFKRRIKILQEAMIKRGISEDGDYGKWCEYREPDITQVLLKTIKRANYARFWRTNDCLWIRNTSGIFGNFILYKDLTDADIKEFCRIHDIMKLVSPEVYGESKLKLDIANEVEFMDI